MFMGIRIGIPMNDFLGSIGGGGVDLTKAMYDESGNLMYDENGNIMYEA